MTDGIGFMDRSSRETVRCFCGNSTWTAEYRWKGGRGHSLPEMVTVLTCTHCGRSRT